MTPSTIHPAPLRSTHWGGVSAVLFAGIVLGLYFGKAPPVLPVIKQELGLSLVSAGFVVSAFNALAMVGAIVTGAASDRFGALRFAIIGSLATGAGGLLGALAGGETTILLSRLVEGVGFVMLNVAAPALVVAASRPDRRSAMLGLWSTYMPAGASIAIVASVLLTPVVGWRGLWVICSVLALFAASALWSNRRSFGVLATPPRPMIDGKPRGGLKFGALRQVVPWLLGTAFALYAMEFLSIMAWLPTYLIETRGMSATAASLMGAVYVAFNLVGCLGGSYMLRMNISRGSLVIFTFVCLAIFANLLFATSLPEALRFAAALGISAVGGLIPAVAFSGSARYAREPGEVGVLHGLVVQLANVGQVMGPPLVAAAVTRFGTWDAALWVMLVCCTFGLVVGVLITRIEAADHRHETRARPGPKL